MIIFGLWSVKNILHFRQVAPTPRSLWTYKKQTTGGSYCVHAKDHQLILMLLIDRSIYVLFSSFMTVSLMYQQFTQYTIKSPKDAAMEMFILTVATYSVHVPFCITSYAHLFVSKTFRSELKNIILCK
jgi:hypothetical protein